MPALISFLRRSMLRLSVVTLPSHDAASSLLLVRGVMANKNLSKLTLLSNGIKWTKSARISIFSRKADYSRTSVTRSNVSPMIAISMLRKVIWVMKVESIKMTKGATSSIPGCIYPSSLNCPRLSKYWSKMMFRTFEVPKYYGM